MGSNDCSSSGSRIPAGPQPPLMLAKFTGLLNTGLPCAIRYVHPEIFGSSRIGLLSLKALPSVRSWPP